MCHWSRREIESNSFTCKQRGTRGTPCVILGFCLTVLHKVASTAKVITVESNKEKSNCYMNKNLRSVEYISPLISMLEWLSKSSHLNLKNLCGDLQADACSCRFAKMNG